MKCVFVLAKIVRKELLDVTRTAKIIINFVKILTINIQIEIKRTLHQHIKLKFAGTIINETGINENEISERPRQLC